MTERALTKILVATDFSDSAWRALEHAAAIAGITGASIDLLHVWELPTFLAPDAMIGLPSTPVPLAKQVAEQAREQMAELVSAAASAGITIGESRVLQGGIAQTICDIAETGGYDLLALGTHGRKGLTHFLLGSIAEKVVRHSKIPVLTVRLAGTPPKS